MSDKKPEGVITLSTLELQAMLAQAVKDGLKAAGVEEGGTSRTLRRITERRVEVRLIDNHVVLAFKNRGSEERPVYIYEVPDPKNPKEMVSMVDLIIEGSEQEPMAVNYSEFRREGERVQCKVLRTEEKEWTITQGVVKRKEVEEYAMVELDYDVPLDVVGKARFFTVELPAGYGSRQVLIHENYVNIA